MCTLWLSVNINYFLRVHREGMGVLENMWMLRTLSKKREGSTLRKKGREGPKPNFTSCTDPSTDPSVMPEILPRELHFFV